MALPNQRLGEYILIDRIGQGAFGEVWRARHHAWADRLVAIKIPSDPQYVRNLQQEGHAVHQLSASIRMPIHLIWSRSMFLAGVCGTLFSVAR